MIFILKLLLVAIIIRKIYLFSRKSKNKKYNRLYGIHKRAGKMFQRNQNNTNTKAEIGTMHRLKAKLSIKNRYQEENIEYSKINVHNL